MKIKIFVVSHKKNNIKKNELYEPIQVGNLSENLFKYRDNISDNISEQNVNYCELTALYWIWKNINELDFIGISHYRRYFTNNIFSKKILEIDNATSIFKKYDIIVPIPSVLRGKSVWQQYSEKHFEKDLKLCNEVIQQKYSDYIGEFNYVMNSNIYSQYNMLICSKENYNHYMNWLFDILFEVEKRNDISKYDDYNKRIYGFLAERLFNVWLLHNKNLRICYLPVINVENKSKFFYLKNMLKYLYVKLKNNKK